MPPFPECRTVEMVLRLNYIVDLRGWENVQKLLMVILLDALLLQFQLVALF